MLQQHETLQPAPERCLATPIPAHSRAAQPAEAIAVLSWTARLPRAGRRGRCLWVDRLVLKRLNHPPERPKIRRYPEAPVPGAAGMVISTTVSGGSVGVRAAYMGVRWAYRCEDGPAAQMSPSIN
jgi:hypothetical protein